MMYEDPTEPQIPPTEKLIEMVAIKHHEKILVAIPFIYLTYDLWRTAPWWIATPLTIGLIFSYLVILALIKWYKEKKVAKMLKNEMDKRYNPKVAIPLLLQDKEYAELLRAIKRAEELGWIYMPAADIVDPAPTLRVRFPPTEETPPPTPRTQPTTTERETPQPRITEEIEEAETEEERETEGEEEEADITREDREAMGQLSQLIYLLEPEELAELIKAIMEHKGYSIRQFARTLGIPRTTLHDYITGRRRPSHIKILDIAPTITSIMTDELISNRDTFIEILRTLAETATRHQQQILEIIQKTIRPQTTQQQNTE